jgi:hypothetical protein
MSPSFVPRLPPDGIISFHQRTPLRRIADHMWSRLTRGGDGLPREKVDAIVRLIDQYLSEEASLRNLQSDKQTIHPRDLPPDKREALIEEIFEILKDARKR